jgi:hypothetical protein
VQFIDKERPVHLLPGKKQGAIGVNFGRYAPFSSRKPCIDENGKVETVQKNPDNDNKGKKTQGTDDLFFC